MLNALWVGLGQLSNSSVQKWIVFVVLAAIVGGLALPVHGRACVDSTYSRTGFVARHRRDARTASLILLVGAGARFEIVDDRARAEPAAADPRLRRRTQPFNNMWLMVVLIWIQTGFAMVIFSSAIKAVPTELTRGGEHRRRHRVQMFWRITLPQICCRPSASWSRR